MVLSSAKVFAVLVEVISVEAWVETNDDGWASGTSCVWTLDALFPSSGGGSKGWLSRSSLGSGGRFSMRAAKRSSALNG